MIEKNRPWQMLTLLCLFFPMELFAEVSVVDDSDNFAIVDEQRADVQPVAKYSFNNRRSLQKNDEENQEIPLAHEESSIKTKNHVTELLNKLQDMQQEIQELRGKIEVQEHTLKLLKEQQLTFYKDLDSRLQHAPNQNSSSGIPVQKKQESLEPASYQQNRAQKSFAETRITDLRKSESVPHESLATPTNNYLPHATNNPVDEQISYMAAYDLIKHKHFDSALDSMKLFVTQYPQGGYTGNAHYWLGELYLLKKNYQQSIEHFQVVLKQFPSSSKTAASTLKIGYALAASGKTVEARRKLQQVITSYPDTPTAQLAATKLKLLKA